MDDQRKQFAEQFARLIDSVNRLMLFAALIVFYFLLTPILFKIEESTEKTAKGIQRQDATLEAIQQGMDKESWQKVKPELEEALRNRK
jgi:hypothetical protein